MPNYVYGGLAGSQWGVVAAEHPLAASAGLWILDEGGNAVDAAVTVSLVLSVVLPHLGGLGGDFFAMVGPDPVWIDGSGPAPSGLTRDLVAGRGHSVMPRRGPLAVTVPGMVEALYRMWAQLGSLPWRVLVEPAARIAEEGFPIHRELVRAVKANRWILERYGTSLLPELDLEEGEGVLVRLPGLARALRRIARDPRDFYEGEIARSLVRAVREAGGVLSLEDMAGYRARISRPLVAEAFGWRLYEGPPPTQGATTLLLLKLLEQEGWEGPLSRRRASLLIEGARRAYRVRDAFITDPGFMEVPVESLLDPSLAHRATGEFAAGSGEDTTYFIVVDGDGRWVSGIQSLYNHFGSGIVDDEFQVPLNNRGADFSLDPGHANRLEPGKRTRHTLSTLVAEREGTTLILGTSGGNYRPQLHALLFTNYVVHGMGLEESVNLPRLVWDPVSRRVLYEEGWDWYGPSLPYPSRLGVAAMARIRGGVAEAYEDPRGVGVAAPVAPRP